VVGDEFDQQAIYDKMVSLGMKKDSLSWQELAERCAVVQSNPDTAIKRTKIITMLMNENLRNELKPSDSVLSSCRRTKFLFPVKRPPSFPSKWKGDDYADGQLISSEDGYLPSSKHLVCSSYPVIDEQRCFSSSCFELKLALGLTNKNVKVETAVLQIEELIRAAAGETFGNNPESVKMLHQMYDDVLAFLNKCLKRKEPSLTPSIASLSSQRCILIDKSQFMLPKQVRVVVQQLVGPDAAASRRCTSNSSPELQ
jgi:hypothetical protein